MSLWWSPLPRSWDAVKLYCLWSGKRSCLYSGFSSILHSLFSGCKSVVDCWVYCSMGSGWCLEGGISFLFRRENATFQEDLIWNHEELFCIVPLEREFLQLRRQWHRHLQFSSSPLQGLEPGLSICPSLEVPSNYLLVLNKSGFSRDFRCNWISH